MSDTANEAPSRPEAHSSQQGSGPLVRFVKQLIARPTMHQIYMQGMRRDNLRPALNSIQITAIGIGNIIGAGIFVLSGKAAAQYAGPSVIVSFIASGVVALLAALSFSELMVMMPLAGAAYTCTYVALGEYAAWFIGWNYALLFELATLTVVTSWSKYIVHFIHLVSDYNATKWLVQSPVAWNEDSQSFYVTGGAINLPAIAISLAITALLISGIRPAAMVNLVLVVFKIIVLLIFIFATCRYVNRDNYTPFIPSNEGSFSAYGASGTVAACGYIFFAYVGFESIATVAEESKARDRHLPYTTIAALIISMLIYIGISTVVVGLVSYRAIDVENPLHGALKATPYGLWIYVLMDLGAIAALTTVAVTTLLAQSRIFYAMAQDGLLPARLGATNQRTATPWLATLISGVLCAAVSGICPIDIVGETTSIGALVTYLFVHIEVIVMRYKHRDQPRPFEVPFGSWLIPVVGSILSILLMATVKAATGYRFLIWTAIGQIIYFSYGFWHSNMRKEQFRQTSFISGVELVPRVDGDVTKDINAQHEPQDIEKTSEEHPAAFTTVEGDNTSEVNVHDNPTDDRVSKKSNEIVREVPPTNPFVII